MALGLRRRPCARRCCWAPSSPPPRGRCARLVLARRRRAVHWLALNVVGRAPLRRFGSRSSWRCCAGATSRRCRAGRRSFGGRAARREHRGHLASARRSPSRSSPISVRRRLRRARLGLAILGLVPVEQLLRRAQPAVALGDQAAVPSALAGDVRLRPVPLRRRLLLGRLDADIWVARGVANALRAFPSSRSRPPATPGWTIEMHLSRGAVFHSTALLVSGRVPAAWSRARATSCATSAATGAGRCRSSCLFAAAAVRRAGGVVRTFPVAPARVRQQAFLLVPLRLSRGVAALHAHALDRQRVAARACRSARSRRWPTWSRVPAGVLWLADDRECSGRPRGSTCRRSKRRVADDASLPAFLRAHRVGRRRSPEFAEHPQRYPELELPAWLAEPRQRLARRSALHRYGARSGSSCCSNPRARDRRRLGSARPPQGRGACRRRAISQQLQCQRSAARGAQVRRLQPHVRVRRARPQEPGGAAFAHAE